MNYQDNDIYYTFYVIKKPARIAAKMELGRKEKRKERVSIFA